MTVSIAAYARRRLRAVSVGLVVLCASASTAMVDANPPVVTSESRLARARAVVRGLEADMTSLLDRVSSSSVTVIGCERVADDDMLTGAGSGVIVSHHGVHVVTNAHVVDECKRVQALSLDGKRYPMRVRASDDKVDLALLEFVGRPPAHHAVSMSARIETMEEGTWVLALGNPFLLALDGQSVASLGVVSGVRDPSHGYSIKSRSIQHDAEINPGNSGGPLWSLSGQLLGINGAIIVNKSEGRVRGPAHSGASFAVPARQVRKFIERNVPGVATPRRPAASATRAQPSMTSETAQAWLGFSYRTTFDSRGDTLGAMVLALHGHHALPGVAVGDVVQSVRTGGKTHIVRSASGLEQALREHRAGDTAVFSILRGSRTFAVTAPLGSR